jgi:hypothetical protein
MIVHPIDATTFISDGPATPADAIAAVEGTLRDRGLDDWDLHELDLRRHVSRAWWGGDEFGFVGADHPQAQQVVVVHLPGDVP